MNFYVLPLLLVVFSCYSCAPVQRVGNRLLLMPPMNYSGLLYEQGRTGNRFDMEDHGWDTGDNNDDGDTEMHKNKNGTCTCTTTNDDGDVDIYLCKCTGHVVGYIILIIIGALIFMGYCSCIAILAVACCGRYRKGKKCWLRS